MTGSPFARAASISDLMYSRANPGLLTAGGPPALDRLQNGFGPLAAERPIDVDNKQRRPLPESSSSPEPACGEYGLVALGEQFVPDPLIHRHRSLPRCTGRFPNRKPCFR